MSPYPVIARENERGAAILEMTLVVPFLLTLGLGVFEFGNIYYKYHLLENAVRDAARFGASRVGDVCNTESLKDEVRDIARRTGTNNDIWTTGYQIDVDCIPYDNEANNFAYRGGDSINSIKVTATVPYKSLGFLGFFNLAPPTLKVWQEERVQGGR